MKEKLSFIKNNPLLNKIDNEIRCLIVREFHILNYWFYKD